jgi:hypothetical protein
MTLQNWEDDEATRLTARDLAAAAIVEHLGARRDVVMAQYFGRLGYIVLLDGVAREHGATFVEVILAMEAAAAIDRFRTRRRAMIERGERHPERDIADGDVATFVHDAVARLTRLPTARPESKVIPVDLEASEDEVYRRLLAVLGEGDQLQSPHGWRRHSRRRRRHRVRPRTPSRRAASLAGSGPASCRSSSSPSVRAMAASASLSRCRGVPSRCSSAHMTHASTSCGTRLS